MKIDKAYIQDILSVIAEIESFTQGLTYEDFLENREAYRAVERDFEIIGEAVKRLSEAFKEQHPEIPWKDIAGFRNVLIHEYAAINALTVWESFERDIPPLKVCLKNALL